MINTVWVNQVSIFYDDLASQMLDICMMNMGGSAGDSDDFIAFFKK